MFEASPAQIPKFAEKTFRYLFLLQAITLKPICGSGVSSKRFFTGTVLAQGLLTRLEYFSHFNFLAYLC